MSMFQVCGTVARLFDAPGRIDKETGMVDDDKPKVQIIGEVPQRNGQFKLEIISLTCHNPADFLDLLGQRVTVPLGMFAPKAGQVLYFIPQGCKPSLAPKEAL
jgi:hypothetical protein